MTILQQIIAEIKSKDLTQQVREVCDKIYEEEKRNFKHSFLEPKGANIFLAVEVAGRTNDEVGFVTLERETEERYVVVYYTLEKERINKETPEETQALRRRTVWVIDENKSEKILTGFAKVYKMLRGE